MKTEAILTSVVAASVAAYLYFDEIERREKMSNKITATEIVGKENKERMAQVEAERLVSAVKAMDEQQLEVMLDQVPIKLILKRIEREFNKQEEFIKSVKASMGILN